MTENMGGVHFSGTKWIPVELWGLMEGASGQWILGRHPLMGRHQKNVYPAFKFMKFLIWGQ